MDGKHSGSPAADQAAQLCLHLPIPRRMHEAGLQDGSRRPMVFERSPHGLGITRRLPAAEAWAVGRCVQHHSDTSWTGIYLDLDSPLATRQVRAAAEGGELAPPNLMIVRRRSGHVAAAWFLQEPVHKYPAARDEPQRLYRRTVEYYRHALDGDPGYTGTTFRNAILAGLDPESWRIERPAPDSYNLSGGLSAYIPRGWRIPAGMTTAEGRHVTLFRMLMKRAATESVSDDDILLLAHGWNQAEARPLPSREVHHIVKHVHGYRAQWRARPGGWHSPEFLAAQSERGRRSGKARRAARDPKMAHVELLATAGVRPSEIARTVGVHRTTIWRWLQGVAAVEE